ncbi:MAG: hypothetical protein ACO3P9_12810, partial [Phycisphaerales bacterium]
MTRPSIVRAAAPLPTRVLLPLVATIVAASPVGLAAQESAAPPRPGIPSAAALVTTPRGDEDVPDSMFVGVWALTDEHNDL